MKPSISVVIPTYNRRHHIGSAVQSVLTQVLPPAEVIVVDDGSTDDTAEVLRQYRDRIRVLTQANQGQAAARNAGAQAASSQWIAFLDSDDRMLPDKLAMQIEFATREAIDVCFHDLAVTDGNQIIVDSRNRDAHSGCPARELQSGEITDPFDRAMQGSAILFTSTLLIRTAVFRRAGGFSPLFRINEDLDLYLRLCDVAKFGFLNESLVLRQEGDNWAADETYQFRALAVQNYLRRCVPARRDTARRALARELRALAGHFRRRGQFATAGRAYLRACLARAGR